MIYSGLQLPQAFRCGELFHRDPTIHSPGGTGQCAENGALVVAPRIIRKLTRVALDRGDPCIEQIAQLWALLVSVDLLPSFTFLHYSLIANHRNKKSER